MSPAEDERLVAYFADRQAWLLEPDKPSPELVPYQPASRPEKER